MLFSLIFLDASFSYAFRCRIDIFPVLFPRTARSPPLSNCICDVHEAVLKQPSRAEATADSSAVAAVVHQLHGHLREMLAENSAEQRAPCVAEYGCAVRFSVCNLAYFRPCRAVQQAATRLVLFHTGGSLLAS